MSAARKRPAADANRVRYEKSAESFIREGDLEPRTWPKGCGRCGGDLLVTPYVVPFDPAQHDAAVDIKTINTCEVCRVDRVKRWSDLVRIARERGLTAGGMDPETMTHVPTARALVRVGLVQYDREDGAWDLTQAGLDALREDDEANRTHALSEWEERGQRFAREHKEMRRRIDSRFPARSS